MIEEIKLTFEDVEKESNKEEINITPKTGGRDDIEFDIIKNFGPLSKKKGAAILSIVNWNGHKKYDLRKWNDDMTIPYKGITFSENEIDELLDISTEIKISNDARIEYEGGSAKAKIFNKVAELSYETVKDITWNKEVNIIDWGYGKKVDLRKWTEDYSRCSKGICISTDEFKNMLNILKDYRG